MDKLLDFFDHLLNRKKTEASCPSYQYIRLTVRKFIESSGNGTGKYMMMSSRYKLYQRNNNNNNSNNNNQKEEK